MANQAPKTFSLDSFKKANKNMIVANSGYLDVFSESRYRRSTLKDYEPEEIERIIESGSLTEQIRLSRNYFYKDGFYKRILLYYATILKYVGILIPNPGYGKKLSTEHIQKKYFSAVDFVETMDLPNLLKTFMLRSLIDGAYYGIIQQVDKKTFSVLDLPAEYCCSRFKDIYGNDMIEFDVTYFNSILEDEARNIALSVYPKIVRTAYNQFKNGKYEKRWVFIPTEIGIYFTFSDGRPLFLNTIPATIEYDEAVDTERERDLEEIRKVIVQKIPHLSTGELLFEPEEAEEIHAGTVGMMKANKNISVLTTYAEVDSIVSKTASDTASNNLEKMMNNIFYEAGTSSQLFAATGNLALGTSLNNDLALVMILGDRFSTFITRLVNDIYANTNISFKYTLLPISYYNEKDYVTNTYKLTSTGYSFLLPAIASGLTQRDLGNVKDLENTVLKLQDKLIALASSATGGGDKGTAGAPAKTAETKAPKTIENEESLDKT